MDMMEDSDFLESTIKYVEWKIRNFSDLPKQGNEEMRSPQFSFFGANWYLRVDPYGYIQNESQDWISMFLMKQYSSVKFSVDVTIGIRKADRSKFNNVNFTYEFPMKSVGNGIAKFIERSFLKLSDGALDTNGTLTVFCIVQIKNQRPISHCLETASQTSVISTLEAESQTLESFNTVSACRAPTDGILTLTDNFKELYLSKRYADVRITVKGREFFAHKVVLTCRSPVFFSMFNSDMAEKDTGKIEITDCEPDYFDEFLLFLYTGKVDMVTSSNAVSLYETADKYDVQELKKECLLCMMQELTTESFCDVVRLAILHDERDLLQGTTYFFIENAKSILVTLKWQNFSAEYPPLANELFLKFVHKYA